MADLSQTPSCFTCYFLQLRNFSNINLNVLLFPYFRGKYDVLIFSFRISQMHLWMYLLRRCLTRTFSFSAISLPSLYQPFVCFFFPFISLLLLPLVLFLPSGQEDYRSRLNGECFQDLVCPEKCRCEGTVVDCSNLKLTRVPPHIPEHTTDL